MSWIDKIAETTFPITVDGNLLNVTMSNLSEVIKNKLKQSKSIMALFNEFEVSPDRLKSLRVEVSDLSGKYAETDAEILRINASLFKDGKFFENYFFVIAHEIVHWLSRIRENDSYFNDPEEILGFVSSIAYEIEQGSDFNSIWNKIYPKVSFHFHNENDAREFFGKMIEKAKKIILKSAGDLS